LAVLACALGLALAGGGSARADDGYAPTGTLTAPGTLSGTVAIIFLLPGGGSYDATITVDGQPLVSETVDQGSAQLYLDTTELTDGSHAVVVAIESGNQADTIWTGTIETSNAPRGGTPTIVGASEVGSALAALPGSWLPTPTGLAYQWERCAAGGACAAIAGAGGQSYVLTAADAGDQLEVAVTASDAEGSTTVVSAPSTTVLAAGQSVIGAGASNGSGACDGAHLEARIGGGASEHVALGEGATISGRLDCNGAPIAGATVDLDLAPASGTAAAIQGQVQTAADGSFSYAVASGPSRDITVSYSAFAGESEPTALATLALLVTPRVTLSITPRSTTNGHTMTLSGRVLGGYIERGGLPLEIEYREGRHWTIYTEILANATTGRFRWRYTFERTTQSINYTFRVVIPATGVAGYPYQPTASRPRSIHVDP
jgi:hypothetical protein